MEDIENTYATKDLHFAAFLQLKGMVVKKLEHYSQGKGRKNPVYFIFDNKEKCTALESVFWNGVGDEVMVNAKDYFTAIRDLRARVFSITLATREKESSYSGVDDKW
jgi:hypothetical protein